MKKTKPENRTGHIDKSVNRMKMAYTSGTCHLIIVILLQTVVSSGEGASTAGRQSHCDEMQNQFTPSPIGNYCHQGTEWDPEIKCCTGCPICGPGFRQQPKCIGPCVKCPTGHFSDEEKNLYCKQCTSCEEVLHRQYIKPCSLTSNAECGHCLPGYTEIFHGSSSECIKEQTTTEEQYGARSATKGPIAPCSHKQTCGGKSSDGLSVHVIVLIAISLLVGFAGAGVGVYCYLKRRKEKRRLNRAENENKKNEEENLKLAQETTACGDQSAGEHKGGETEKLFIPVKSEDEPDGQPSPCMYATGSSTPPSGITLTKCNDAGVGDHCCRDESCQGDDESLDCENTCQNQDEENEEDSMQHMIPTTVAPASKTSTAHTPDSNFVNIHPEQ